MGELAEEIEKELFDSVVELNMDKVASLCKAALEQGIDAERIFNGLTRGLDEVGRKYEKNEYFLAELIAAGELMKTATEILKPHLAVKELSLKRAKMIIGTVEGDIHDIGKNLVIAVVSTLGLDIIDLGVDVPAEKFVEAVKTFKPEILGLSALLTTTMPQMKRVVEALKKERLRDTVKIIVGGRPITQKFAEEIGADAYAKDAFDAREAISKWIFSN